MASVTHWGRLEPRCRTDDFAAALSAQVRDPLWMLARQWQFGEFDGDDSGSPVIADLTYGVTPIVSYRAPSDDAAVAIDDTAGPLEALVEREHVPVDLRTRVQAGLQFARYLDRRGAGGLMPAFLDAVPFGGVAVGEISDDASERFAAAVVGRVVDGGILLETAAGGNPLWGLPPAGEIPVDDHATVAAVAADLLDWFTRTYGPRSGGGAWNPAQLEYEFGVSVAGASPEAPTLAADEYPGGTLDWHDLDCTAPPPPSAEEHSRRFLPAPVQFHGMPSSRWWEFEDGRTDFGAVRPNATDLVRLLLAEFALIYADDWFAAPLAVPSGALVTLNSLVVTDTFGERTQVEAAGSRAVDTWQRFGLFRLDRRDDARPLADVLFNPPVATAALHGRAIEEVVLFRDEMANLAWGVEHVLPNALGEPVSGHDAFQADLRRRPEPTVDDTELPLSYRLMTDVAENWLPFQAVRRDDARRALALELTPFLREDAGGGLVGVAPKGRILQPGIDPYRVAEEAIPTTPRLVTRAFQRARTAHGRTHLWIGRRRSPARGLGASGLEFDRLDERRGPDTA